MGGWKASGVGSGVADALFVVGAGPILAVDGLGGAEPKVLTTMALRGEGDRADRYVGGHCDPEGRSKGGYGAEMALAR